MGDLSQVPDLGLPIGETSSDALRLAIERRPDLRAAAAEVDRFAAENRWHRATSSPAVTVAAGYERDGRDQTIVARMSVPLMLFNRNQAGILRSEAEIRQARNLYEALLAEVGLQVQQAFNAVQVNRERVEYIRTRQVRQAEEASRVSQGAGSKWRGSLVALMLGASFGYVAYPWIAPQASGPFVGVAGERDGEDPRPVPVRTFHIPLGLQQANAVEPVAAEVREFESYLRVPGNVLPDQKRISRIRLLARGVVDRVFVQLGDHVRDGDPLVSYDNIDLGLAISEFLVARADLRSVRTTVEVKESLFARSREMLAVGAVARTEHDVLESEYRSAQHLVESALAAVAKFEEQIHRFGLSVEDLERLAGGSDSGYHRTVSHSILRAPSSGIVTAYGVAHGEVIDPFSELLTVTDTSEVWVLADVKERDLHAVRVGKEVTIRVAAYPGETFKGTIDYAGDTIDERSRAAHVRCVTGNRDGRLKLGIFATVDIPSGESRHSLAVPAAALQDVSERRVVFVRRSATEFERREVDTGLESDGWVEILSGLAPGEAVIARGSRFVKAVDAGRLDGARI